jgi:hypothetical protein
MLSTALLAEGEEPGSNILSQDFRSIAFWFVDCGS